MRLSKRQLPRLDNAVHQEPVNCEVCTKTLFGDEPLHNKKRYHADCLVELGKREERAAQPINYPVVPFTPQPILIPANPGYPGITISPNTYPMGGGTGGTVGNGWWTITTTDNTASSSFTADDFSIDKWNRNLWGFNVTTSQWVDNKTTVSAV